MADQSDHTGDVVVVLAAASVVGIAYTAWHLPTRLNVAVVLALVLLAATVARREARVLLFVVVVLITGQHSAANLAALQAPLPDSVDGVGRLISDPEVRQFDMQVIVEVEGRRYQASVPLESSTPLRSMLTGEYVTISGRPQMLEGAPIGWVLSWHLAGRLKVSSVGPGPPPLPWYRIANSLRRTIGRGSESLGDERAPLYMGLVVGDDRGQSYLLQFRFGASGLTHLLAVSGQNVSFLLAVAEPLLRRMGPRSKLLLAAVLLAVFTMVTRGEPSVLRAVVMAGVAMVAVTTGRVASGTRVLALTVIVLVMADPQLVHSMGFQLSIAATTGLLVLARPIEVRMPGPKPLRLPLAVTMAAQVATAPLILRLADGLPAAATPANLLAVPPSGLVMMLGVTAGVVAGVVREPFAKVMLWPAGLLTGWIDWVAEWGSKLPLGVLGAVDVAVAGAAVGLVLARPVGRWRHPVTALGVACLLLVCWPTAPSVGAKNLSDGATLWVGACGGTVLVLGGGVRADQVMEALWALEVRHIDVAVVDGGRPVERVLVPLKEQFGVRRVISNAEAVPAGNRRLADSPLQVGDLVVSLGSAGDVRVGPIGGECKF